MKLLLVFSSLISGLVATSFSVNGSDSLFEIPDEFLSVTIDAGLASDWDLFDLNSTLVNTLAKGLSNSYFRYGGTPADQTVYTFDNGQVSDPQSLSFNQFLQLSQFALRNNWKFIFGLNAQQRFDNNTWNPHNSKQLIDAILNYSPKDSIVYGFELGNEPDLYFKHDYFTVVSGVQMAKDFLTLYDLIQSSFGDQWIDSIPLLWGCDIAEHHFGYLAEYAIAVNEIASQLGSLYIDGLTWHFYYASSETYTTIADFISVAHLDSLMVKLEESLAIASEELSSYDIPVILGETSSTSHDGTPNISASFAAGFMWLDKLGLSARFGLKSVIRQSFWSGSYSLIGTVNGSDYNPNPDYWSSHIFKSLIGNRVLSVGNDLDIGRSIRVYAFCTRVNNDYNYNRGSVSVLVLNLQNTTVDISLDMAVKTPSINNDSYLDLYLLTSYPGVLNSRDIFLNGVPLQMIDDSTLPPIIPKRADITSSVQMEALSYGFIVMANANAPACLN